LFGTNVGATTLNQSFNYRSTEAASGTFLETDYYEGRTKVSGTVFLFSGATLGPRGGFQA